MDAVDTAFFWDAQGYRRILHTGYHISPGEYRPPTAYFPLVSWIAKVPDLVMSSEAAMVLVANLTALAAFIAIWGVARAWRDEKLARASVILIALWPPTLFFWAFYSEALFVAASTGAVWADRRGHRLLAGLLLGATAMTRSVGVAIGATVVAVRVWRTRRIDGVAVWYGVCSLAGLGAVMLAQHIQAHDAFAFLNAPKDWGRSMTFPWVTLREGIGSLKSSQPRLARWLDLGGIIAMGLAVVWAVWPRSRLARRSRLPAESWALTIAILIFPLCSGLLSSMNRYIASAWSGFVILAAWLATTDRRVRAVVYVVLAVASVFYIRYYADGASVA